ncbi:Na+/H+ antiporter subunit E [Arhodomonas sp. SL1]|uniref:Na+/H+ antiporter subunit E n=1 Tax=Arhodomonas sp. SL1 TaxID=3425691 RepID=UPI003F8831A7
MRYASSLAAVLVLLWLGLSGVYKPLILGLGAASIALVVWIARRMDVVGVEHNPVLYSWRLPVYWGWLLWQIALANLQVAACALQPSRLRPQVVRVPVPHRTAVAKVTYGNSVTLTPGTVTLLLAPDELTAHALHQDAADDLKSGKMAERIVWLESGRSTEGGQS